MTCGVREECTGKLREREAEDYTYCDMVYSEHTNAAGKACWKWAQNQTHVPSLSMKKLID